MLRKYVHLRCDNGTVCPLLRFVTDQNPASVVWGALRALQWILANEVRTILVYFTFYQSRNVRTLKRVLNVE